MLTVAKTEFLENDCHFCRVEDKRLTELTGAPVLLAEQYQLAAEVLGMGEVAAKDDLLAAAAAPVFSPKGWVATRANKILDSTRAISHVAARAAQAPMPSSPPAAATPTASATVTITMTPSVRRLAMSSWKARAMRLALAFRSRCRRR